MCTLCVVVDFDLALACIVCLLVMAPRKEKASETQKQTSDLELALPATKRPRVEPTQVVTKPALEDAKANPSIGIRAIMKTVIPWVNQELLKSQHWARGQGDRVTLASLAELTPLVLPPVDGSEGSGAVGYKEPWHPDHCAASCSRSGMYEAAGAIFWLDPEVASQCASRGKSWLQVGASCAACTLGFNVGTVGVLWGTVGVF
jgi:hypothetical protein